jgi:hypothetical protein
LYKNNDKTMTSIVNNKRKHMWSEEDIRIVCSICQKNKDNKLYHVPIVDIPMFTNRIITEQHRKRMLGLREKFPLSNMSGWPKTLQRVYKIFQSNRARKQGNIKSIFDNSIFDKKLETGPHPKYAIIYAVIFTGKDSTSEPSSKHNKKQKYIKKLYVGQTHQYLIQRFINHITTATNWSKSNLKNHHLYRFMRSNSPRHFIIVPLERIMASRTRSKNEMSELVTK